MKNGPPLVVEIGYSIHVHQITHLVLAAAARYVAMQYVDFT